MREVEFLGVVIGPEGIKMEKEKVKGVLEWPTLKCVKDVQKFLELANYYRWFIEGFTMVASVKTVDSGLHLFLFSLFCFIFSFFSFLFYFLFLEQLRLGVISHAVTSVTN